jgi:hypothetical protein
MRRWFVLPSGFSLAILFLSSYHPRLCYANIFTPHEHGLEIKTRILYRHASYRYAAHLDSSKTADELSGSGAVPEYQGNSAVSQTIGDAKRRVCLLALTVALALLIACNPPGDISSDDSSSTDQQQETTPFSDAELERMHAVEQTASGTYDVNYSGLGPSSAAAAAVASISGQPGVEAASASTDGSTVWIRFDSGVVYCIARLIENAESSGGYVKARSLYVSPRDISEFPASTRKALVCSSDIDGAIMSCTNSFIKSYLQDYGYDPDTTTCSGSDFNPLDFPEAVKAAQIVDINSHGVLLTSGPVSPEKLPFFDDVAVLTSLSCDKTTTAGKENLRTYSRFLTGDEGGGGVIEGHFIGPNAMCYDVLAFTSRFVARYLSTCIQPGTLVIGDFCYSTFFNYWPDAFRAVGASAFVGWDWTVGIRASRDALTALVGLLSGKGEYGNSKDDPVNLSNAVDLVHKMNLGTSATAGANLEVAFGDTWGLMPHLDSFSVVGTTVRLEGAFGAQAGEVRVERHWPGSSVLTVISPWSFSEIICEFPWDISAGDLAVFIGTRKSNTLSFGVTRWAEMFDSSPVGAIQLQEGWGDPVSVSSDSGGWWIGAYFQLGDQGAEITTGHALRIWSRGDSGHCWTNHILSNSDTSKPVFSGLHFGFDATCDANWITNQYSSPGGIEIDLEADSGSPQFEIAHIHYILDHEQGYPYGASNTIALGASGVYERDIWQDLTFTLGREPAGFFLRSISASVSTDDVDYDAAVTVYEQAALTLDNLWIHQSAE